MEIEAMKWNGFLYSRIIKVIIVGVYSLYTPHYSNAAQTDAPTVNPTTIAQTMSMQYLLPLQKPSINLDHKTPDETINLKIASYICYLNERNRQKKNDLKPRFDFNDFPDQLNVVCGKKNKDGTYSPMYLHKHLAKHIQLDVGHIKSVITLGTTKTAEELTDDQKILQEMIKENTLHEEIKQSIARIKKFAKQVLSLWNTEATDAIRANGFSLTRGTLAPLVATAQEIEHQVYKNNGALTKATVQDLEQSPYVLAGLAGISALSTASMMPMGWSIVEQGYARLATILGNMTTPLSGLSLKTLTTSLSSVPLSTVAVPPLVLLATHSLIEFMLQKSLKKNLTCILNDVQESLKNSQQELPNSIKSHALSATFTFMSEQAAQDCATTIAADFPTLQATCTNQTVLISFSAQKERHLRAAHPLTQNKTLATLAPLIILGIIYMGSPYALLTKLLSSSFSLISLPWGIMKTVATGGAMSGIAAATLFLGPKKFIVDTAIGQEKVTEKLQALKQVIKEIDVLRSILLSNPVLKEKMKTTLADLDIESTLDKKIAALKITDPQYQTLTRHQQKLQELFEILEQIPEKSTQAQGFFSHMWRKATTLISSQIPAAYNIMCEIKGHFTTALEALGDIDMRQGFAELIKEYKDKQITFSFPTYETGTKPHFKATKLWLPHFIDRGEDTIVPCDIELGGDQPHNAILTGANQGGKTSLLKKIGIAYAMALTVGFAAVQDLSLTIPAYVFVAINKQDSMGEDAVGQGNKGQSGFGSEIHTMNNFVTILKSLNPNTFCVGLFDELCGNANCGGFFSKEFVRQNFPSRNDNLLSVITSLFEEPKYLARDTETKNYFTNYKFADADSYRLEKGVCLDGNYSPVTLERALTNESARPNLIALEKAGLLTRSACQDYKILEPEQSSGTLIPTAV